MELNSKQIFQLNKTKSDSNKVGFFLFCMINFKRTHKLKKKLKFKSELSKSLKDELFNKI